MLSRFTQGGKMGEKTVTEVSEGHSGLLPLEEHQVNQVRKAVYFIMVDLDTEEPQNYEVWSDEEWQPEEGKMVPFDVHGDLETSRKQVVYVFQSGDAYVLLEDMLQKIPDEMWTLFHEDIRCHADQLIHEGWHAAKRFIEVISKAAK